VKLLLVQQCVNVIKHVETVMWYHQSPIHVQHVDNDHDALYASDGYHLTVWKTPIYVR